MRKKFVLFSSALAFMTCSFFYVNSAKATDGTTKIKMYEKDQNGRITCPNSGTGCKQTVIGIE